MDNLHVDLQHDSPFAPVDESWIFPTDLKARFADGTIGSRPSAWQTWSGWLCFIVNGEFPETSGSGFRIFWKLKALRCSNKELRSNSSARSRVSALRSVSKTSLPLQRIATIMGPIGLLWCKAKFGRWQDTVACELVWFYQYVTVSCQMPVWCSNTVWRKDIAPSLEITTLGNFSPAQVAACRGTSWWDAKVMASSRFPQSWGSLLQVTPRKTHSDRL